MPTFYNQATLSYRGGATNSNIVSGEVIGTLRAAKTAVTDTYGRDSVVTYIVSIVNTGATAYTGLTLTDDLGRYTLDEAEVVPLTYVPGSLHYYVNGDITPALPEITSQSPLTLTGITVPAGGSATLVYSAEINSYAPLEAGSVITNTAVISGGQLAESIEASETITVNTGSLLTITKSIYPNVVSENGRVTYTFVIQNSGNEAADASADLVVTDNFVPVLKNITVTYNGTAWTEGTNYEYSEATGIFRTLAGQITVPAATYTRAADNSLIVEPGTAVITVSGNIS